MYVHIPVYVYIYMHVYIPVYIYIHIYIHTYVKSMHIYICMYVCIYIYICMYAHVYIYIYIHACTCIHICIYIHIYIYIYTYTHIYIYTYIMWISTCSSVHFTPEHQVQTHFNHCRWLQHLAEDSLGIGGWEVLVAPHLCHWVVADSFRLLWTAFCRRLETGTFHSEICREKRTRPFIRDCISCCGYLSEPHSDW